MIFFVSDIAEKLLDYLNERPYENIALLTDTNTCSLIPPEFEKLTQNYIPIIIPAGEQHKNLSNAQFVWENMKTGGMNRKSLLINLGGGMITDLGGFCASAYMRGIPFVNIPTSLLSMVDAAVGGKTGINMAGVKNLVGTFHNADEIWIHCEFLNTLPNEELKNGWGEVIKHGIISGGYLWEVVNQGIPDRKETQIWTKIISANIELKKRITDADPRESGLRKTLNLGHTTAHALETVYMQHGEYISHGHAVAIGMIVESIAGVEAGITLPETAEKIKTVVAAEFDLPVIPENWIPSIISGMRSDKKNEGHNLRFALPVSIGTVDYEATLGTSEMISALHIYHRYAT